MSEMACWTPFLPFISSFQKGDKTHMRCEWKSYFYLLPRSKHRPVFSGLNRLITDEKAVFRGRSESGARVTWAPPLFPAAGARPLLAPASLRQHSGAALGALGKGKNTLLASRRPPPHWKPCSLSSTTHLKSTHTRIFLFLFQLPFLFFGETKKQRHLLEL